MRNLMIATMLAAALALAGLGVQAATDQPAAPHNPQTAQSDVLYQCPVHPDVISTKPGKCPKCGRQLVARTKMQVMEEAHKAAGIHGGTGMSGPAPSMEAMHAIMLRQRMLVNAHIDNADPVALLAMADSLKLTKKQSAKLEAIAASARKQALAVLTKEQKATLETVPAKPSSVMDLFRQAAAARHGQGKLPPGHPALPAPK